MNKADKLREIADKIETCRECKKSTHGKAVPGEGSPEAKVVFVGEAPGKTEAETGRPFVGRSGQLLRSLIRETGLKEADVYITSPVKYLPKRGTPNKQQIAHGRTHLIKQLTIINPKVVVLLGNVACQGILQEKVPVLKEHGKLITKDGKTFLVTLHPAAVIRFPKYKKLIIQDFAKLKELIVDRLFEE